MPFVDDHQRHEAPSSVGQGDRHPTIGKVKHPKRIERVPVKPNDRLIVDRSRLATMSDLPRPPASFALTA
jgi:hypothetical protein